MFIPGFVISVATFLGVIVHELAHLLFCKIAGVRVRKYCLFRVGNPAGYVIHDRPESVFKNFLISFGPVVVNTVVAAVIFFLAVLSQNLGAWFWLFMWLGVSVGMHAFPSTGDGKALYSAAMESVKKGNILSVIYIPFAALTYLGALAAVFWGDLLYALAIYFIISGMVTPVSVPITDNGFVPVPSAGNVIENDVISFTYSPSMGMQQVSVTLQEMEGGFFEGSDMVLAAEGYTGAILVGTEDTNVLYLDLNFISIFYFWEDSTESISKKITVINGQEWYIQKVRDTSLPTAHLTLALTKCGNGLVTVLDATVKDEESTVLRGLLNSLECKQPFYNTGVWSVELPETTVAGNESRVKVSLRNAGAGQIKIFIDEELTQTVSVDELDLKIDSGAVNSADFSLPITFDTPGKHSVRVELVPGLPGDIYAFDNVEDANTMTISPDEYDVGVDYVSIYWSGQFIAGQDNNVEINLKNSLPAELSVFVDGKLEKTLRVDANNIDYWNSINLPMAFDAGTHIIKAEVRPLGGFTDSNSFNNSAEERISVLPADYFNVGVNYIYIPYNIELVAGKQIPVDISLKNDDPAILRVFIDGVEQGFVNVDSERVDYSNDVNILLTFPTEGEHLITAEIEALPGYNDFNAQDNTYERLVTILPEGYFNLGIDYIYTPLYVIAGEKTLVEVSMKNTNEGVLQVFIDNAIEETVLVNEGALDYLNEYDFNHVFEGAGEHVIRAEISPPPTVKDYDASDNILEETVQVYASEEDIYG